MELYDEPRILDVSAITYEEFTRLLFEDLAVMQAYDNAEASRPDVVIEYMTKTFREIAALSRTYSAKQIDDGLEFLLNPYYFDLVWYLFDPSASLAGRAECIRSMYAPFAEIVAKAPIEEPMPGLYYMWWDEFARHFWTYYSKGRHDVELGDEARFILNVMFETLVRVLAIPDNGCQLAAVHGLGHLHHPDVARTVQQYIDEHRGEFSPEGLEWFEQCRDGTVM